MNIYLLKQEDNNGYDTYDSMVVIAKNSSIAKTIHPIEELGSRRSVAWKPYSDAWAVSPKSVVAYLIGTADPNADEGIVLSSFNAG